MSKRIQRDYLFLVSPLWKRANIGGRLCVCEVGPDFALAIRIP